MVGGVAGSVAAVLSFLSDAWIAALHDAAAGDEALARSTADLGLCIEQCVTDGPDGEFRYHVRFDHGEVSVSAGPADDPDIRFTTDRETATAIAAGRRSAQRAFMTGDLRIGGDLRAVLDHGEALAGLDDAFGPVRARTDLSPRPAETAETAERTDA